MTRSHVARAERPFRRPLAPASSAPMYPAAFLSQGTGREESTL